MDKSKPTSPLLLLSQPAVKSMENFLFIAAAHNRGMEQIDRKRMLTYSAISTLHTECGIELVHDVLASD